MDPLGFGILVTRVANAILWSALTIVLVRDGRPISRLARRMILFVVFSGMWTLAFGGTTALGWVPGDVARSVYTSFTAFAGLVAIGLLIGPRHE